MSLERPFEGKIIAITGAASGIGLATAHLLVTRGAKLSLADISSKALQEAVKDIRKKTGDRDVISSTVDVREYSQVEAWITQTISHFGRIDGCANLAGVIPRSIGLKGIEDQDFDEWEFILGVNLTGVMHCMRAQLRAVSNNGSVVNAASIAGLVGRSKNASYTASKHGVVGLTRSAAKEVGERGVRVNCICPGRIETPMVAKADRIAGADAQEKGTLANMSAVALQRSGQPEEVAKLIAFLLSDESSYMTGTAIPIDGGWNC